jgi:hypothetical protein
MSMYQIVRQLDGRYRTECEIQDGLERHHFKDVEEAVKSLIREAKVMNGTTIRRRDIRFGHEEQVVRTIVIED